MGPRWLPGFYWELGSFFLGYLRPSLAFGGPTRASSGIFGLGRLDFGCHVAKGTMGQSMCWAIFWKLKALAMISQALPEI